MSGINAAFQQFADERQNTIDKKVAEQLVNSEKDEGTETLQKVNEEQNRFVQIRNSIIQRITGRGGSVNTSN